MNERFCPFGLRVGHDRISCKPFESNYGHAWSAILVSHTTTSRR